MLVWRQNKIVNDYVAYNLFTDYLIFYNFKRLFYFNHYFTTLLSKFLSLFTIRTVFRILFIFKIIGFRVMMPYYLLELNRRVSTEKRVYRDTFTKSKNPQRSVTPGRSHCSLRDFYYLDMATREREGSNKWERSRLFVWKTMEINPESSSIVMGYI